MQTGAATTQFADYLSPAPYEPTLGAKAGRQNFGDFQGHMHDIFGSEKLAIVPTMSYDLDQRSELAHSTTGLKYALRGRATVIEATVGERLASFQDPIKAILPVRMVNSHRVIVTTAEVVGGRALIVPERATARTVAVKRTSREVQLERFGGDLEMGLNLQHEIAMFKAELELKLKAQQRELERVLIEIGYDTLLSGGMRLETAILRSGALFNDSIDNGGDGMRAIKMEFEAARIYYNKCFGVMNKTAFPMRSILGAAKKASAFSIGAPGSMMIVPHGMDVQQYGRPEAMIFNINGLKTTDNKPITMELGTAHTDPATNIKMMAHIPLPTYEYGSANPRVGLGCLSEVVSVLTYYVVYDNGRTTLVDASLRQATDIMGQPGGDGGGEFGIYPELTRFSDLESERVDEADGRGTPEVAGEKAPPKGDIAKDSSGTFSGDSAPLYQRRREPATGARARDLGSYRLYVRRTRVAMSSAILAAPGSDTGELLVGMPHTGVSTSQTDETMKMQLRVYLGAVLKRPESVIILPHIVCDGFVSQTTHSPRSFDASEDGDKSDFEDWVNGDYEDDGATEHGHDQNEHDLFLGQYGGERGNKYGGEKEEGVQFAAAAPGGVDVTNGWPVFKLHGHIVCAAGQHVDNGGGGPEVKVRNQGHFGIMDDPANSARIGGLDGECHPSIEEVMMSRGK